ncbi:MAG: polyprenyl synthetase family protein [Flavobacteriales bacterium]
MAAALDLIKAPIREEMEQFEDRFKEEMKSSVPLLDRITYYIIRRKGKQLRPILVFLSAKLCGGVTGSTYHAAALIELLHTATLVHDDVVDDAGKRRNYFSLNALWKNKIAVLVGDYLLSRGLLLSVENKEHDLLRIVSNAVKEMSEGELLQMEQTRRLNITEETYLRIIRKKTAALISACCTCGAVSAGADSGVVEKMRQFGELTGMAFQVKDDLFDYGNGAATGKPSGIDIKERKLTLPLIHTLNKVTSARRRRIKSIIKNHNHEKQKVQEVIEVVKSNKGIDYAHARMLEYRDESIKILRGMPPNASRDALELLVNYTVERSK